MKSADTNVIVRFLAKDDPTQFKKAYKLFSNDELFISDTVILETEWVLRYTYGFVPEDVCRAFSGLFGLPNVHTVNPVVTHQAIQWHNSGLDFADALHLANSQHCTEMLTFDRSFVKSSKGLSPCEVCLP